MKRKKGVQFAGIGLDIGGGGGGGGSTFDISTTEIKMPFTYKGTDVYGRLYELPSSTSTSRNVTVDNANNILAVFGHSNKSGLKTPIVFFNPSNWSSDYSNYQINNNVITLKRGLEQDTGTENIFVLYTKGV